MYKKIFFVLSWFLAFFFLGKDARCGDEMAGDVGISTYNQELEICFADKENVTLSGKITNYGSFTETEIEFGWKTLNNDGTSSWIGNLNPNNHFDFSLSGISFPREGDFEVKLWVKNLSSDANVSNDSITVLVHVLPEFKIDVNTDTTVCHNSQTNFSVPNIYNSYHWNTGQTGNSIFVNVPGMYFVTVLDDHGCSAVDSFNVNVHPYPAAMVPDDTVLCDGEIFSLDVDDGFESYIWNTGLNTSHIDVLVSGNYAVTVVDTNGCEHSDDINVDVLPVPNPGVNGQYEICEGDTALISAANNYNSYQWNTGDTGNYIEVNSAGVYVVTVTGANGCFAIDTASLTVLSLPSTQFNQNYMCNNESFVLEVGAFYKYNWNNGSEDPYLVVETQGVYNVTVQDFNGCFGVDTVVINNYNVSVELGDDTVICEGGAAFAALPSGVYDQILWDDGDDNPIHYIGSSGIHSVTVTNGSCSVSDQIRVYEDPIPFAEFNFQVNSPEVEFENLSNGNNIWWDFGDQNTSVDVSPIHSYANSGTYEVTLVLSNVCGSDTLTQVLNIFPQNNTVLHEIGEISIYPTITSDFINVNFASSIGGEHNYQIYDVTGKLLFVGASNASTNQQTYRINVSNLAGGWYLIKFVSNKSLIATNKFLIK